MKGVPDKALRQALRENGIRKAAELPRLSSLCWTEYRLEARLPYTGVTSLAGLEPCTELEHVEMHGAVEDLTPLANAKKLRELWIHLAPGTSLAPLSGLTSLVALSAKYGGGDVSALTGFLKLEKLVLDHTPIDDLTPIADLPALREVTLWDSKKLDVSPGTKNRAVLLGWLARGVQLHHEAHEELKKEAIAAARERGGTSLADRLQQLGEPRAATLLARGEATDPDGNTVLHLAAVGPMFESAGKVDRVATTRAVLDAGGIDLEATEKKDGLTALGLAAAQIKPDLEVVKLLLERGADPNRARLEKAIKTSAMLNGPHEALLELLLPRLTRPWTPDVLDSLIDIGADKWVVLALERDEVDVTAVARGYRRTALHAAAFSNRVELVRLLLEKGADPKRHCESWATPLHLGKSAEVAKLLLDAGAEVDALNPNGDTPLTKAEAYERVEKCHLLLDRGASVKTINQQKRNVLHQLVGENRDGNHPRLFELFERLAKAGADFEAKDIDGKIPLERAYPPEVKKVLRQLMKKAD